MRRLRRSLLVARQESYGAPSEAFRRRGPSADRAGVGVGLGCPCGARGHFVDDGRRGTAERCLRRTRARHAWPGVSSRYRPCHDDGPRRYLRRRGPAPDRCGRAGRHVGASGAPPPGRRDPVRRRRRPDGTHADGVRRATARPRAGLPALETRSEGIPCSGLPSSSPSRRRSRWRASAARASPARLPSR